MIVKDFIDSEELSLEDFLDICDDFGEIKSKKDYEKFFIPLIRLANNNNLLIDFLNSGLTNPDKFQFDKSYSMQSLALAEREHYDIRMNFWPTSNEFDISNKSVSEFFAYYFPHDHNFDLITTGYTQNGYVTDIYNYTYDRYEPGDEVDLEFNGRYELTKGRIMLYESSKDIHTQFPPNQLAISINVLPKQKSRTLQYSFDLENKKVNSIIKSGTPDYSLKAVLDSIDDKDLIKLFNQAVK